jgi:hypothetical protein
LATIHSEPAPSGTGSAVVELVDLVVAVGAGAVVVVGALVAVGGLVRGLIVEAGAGVVGAVVVAGAVLVGGAVVGAGAVVVGAEVALAVGAAVGVGVVPLLATLNFPRRLDLVPSDHVSPTRMRCDPSASFEVSYGSAVPLRAVPTRSEGQAHYGSNRWRRTRRAVQVEIDLVESRLVPYEDVDLPLLASNHRAARQPTDRGSGSRQVLTSRSGSRLHTQAAHCEDDADTECDHEFAAAQRRPRPSLRHVHPSPVKN